MKTKTHKSVSSMIFGKDEEENKAFLKWLGFVYPRFKEFYDNLDTSPGVRSKVSTISAFSLSEVQDLDDIDKRDYHFGEGDRVPAEMFCEVNYPKEVSSANLILSGI